MWAGWVVGAAVASAAAAISVPDPASYPAALSTASNKPATLSVAAGTKVGRRRCTVAANESVLSGGDGWREAWARRDRRDLGGLLPSVIRRQTAGNSDCTFGSSAQLQGGGGNRHSLDLLGGLTIEWAGGSHPEMIVVCSVSTAELLATGKATNVYTSPDNGNSFLTPSGVSGLVSEALFSSVADASTGEYMAYAIPSEPGGVVLWASANSGRDWVGLRVESGAAIVQVAPHPSRADVILALTSGTDRNLVVCYNIAGAVSSGGTLVCNQLQANVVNFAWSEAGADQDTVYTMVRGEGDSHTTTFVRYSYVVPSRGQPVRQVVMPPGVSSVSNFEEMNQYVFLTDVPGVDSTESNLYVSSNKGMDFQKARFPFQGSNNHFTVVDASEDFVMVAVDHNRTRVQGSTVVNVYSEGGSSLNFSAYRALFSEVIPTEGTTQTGIVYDTQNALGCPGSSSTMSTAIRGKYLLLRRGECKFYLKAQIAEAMGAIGLIIVNNANTHRLYMQAPDGITMPNISVVIISSSDGNTLIRMLGDGGGAITVNLQEIAAAETVLYRQSNLYASDRSGLEFSISLKNVLYEAAADTGGLSSAYTDVYKVASMNGTYIANYKRQSDSKELTVITYDKGAYWWTLPLPADSRQCSEDNTCALRLVLESTNQVTGFPMPHSTSSAMGIILANGWIQDGTSELPFTVMTRDGGLTWHRIQNQRNSEVFFAPHDYRILDHGAVIVFTPHRQQTTTVAYSLDEGQSGKVFVYDFIAGTGTDDNVIIQGVVTEPGGTTRIAYAYYVGDNRWEGVRLDFENVLGSACASQDYASWNPQTPAPKAQCILGQEWSFQRRQACTQCWNQRVSTQPTSTHPCRCANQDFRCTMGLHRPNNVDAHDVECVLDYDAGRPPCNHNGKIVRYALISDDLCTNAEQSGFLDAVSMPCTPSESLGEEVGKAIGYLVAAALIGVLLIGFVFTFSKDAREAALGIFGTDGKIGSFLLNFNCFRRAEATYIYSKLNDHTDALFEEDDDDDDANQLGLYDDDEDEGEEDDDDMLFSMADDSGSSNRGLPIADY